MNKINITNQNREKQNIWFEEVKPNIYTINTTSDYALKYASINYDVLSNESMDYDFYSNGIKGRIISFDPAGGPYISIGNYQIDNKTLERIYEFEGQTYFKVKLYE
jgi:hypothetical protein